MLRPGGDDESARYVKMTINDDTGYSGMCILHTIAQDSPLPVVSS